jgi:Mg2+ and Co2+ transporter CorA
MTLKANSAAMTNTKMTRSEKIVTGLAVAVLVAGFATGVFAKPINASPHAPGSAAHMVSGEAHRDR